MTIRTGGGSIGVRSLLLILAVICFIVSALPLDIRGIDITAVGLAFFAAAFLVDDRRL